MWLDKVSIRHLFNGLGIWRAAQTGKYQMRIRRDSPCPYPDEPPGTRAQEREILDGQRLIALVHGYWRPDGSLGASGRPDPLKVLHGRVMYCLAGPGTPPAKQEQDD